MIRKTAILLIVGVFLIVTALGSIFAFTTYEFHSANGQAAAKEKKGSVKKEQAGSSDRLAQMSLYLKANGINCSFENTYGTSDSLAVDPKNPETIYVGIEGRGVYKSDNSGTSWKKIIKGLVAYPDMNNKSESCFPDISDIYIDPNNTRRLLLITSDITTGYVFWPYGETGGIWESTDGGKEWRQLLLGEINAAGSGTITVDPKDPLVMYYPANPDPPTFRETPIKTGLMKLSSVYKTLDGGKRWQEIPLPMLPGLQAHKIFIDPKNSDHVLFFTQSHDHIYSENSITEVFLYKQHAVLESFDGGQTFTTLAERLPSPYRALFDADVSPKKFDHFIVRPFLFGPEFPGEKTRQKSFYTTDGGKTFRETPFFIWTGRYDPHDTAGNHLLGYASEMARIMESTDGGKTWTDVGTPAEVANYSVRVSNFVWDTKNSKTVYMSGDRGHVWRSTDGGKTWTNILNLQMLPK